MKELFDYTNMPLAITGAHPLTSNDNIVDYFLSKVVNAEEALVDAGKSLAVAPMNRDQFMAALIKHLDGSKPKKGWLVDTIVDALNDLYDRADVTNVLSPFEEDSFLEYVAWLKGGYTTLEGEVVPFVKPDEDGLVVAATAIEKMVKARA